MQHLSAFFKFAIKPAHLFNLKTKFGGILYLINRIISCNIETVKNNGGKIKNEHL